MVEKQEEQAGKKTCVQDIVKGIQKEQRAIESKSRDIHRRAEEMTAEGKERMDRGIKAVAAKIPAFEREIARKVKDIHDGAEEMTAEGEKRMSAGIEAVKQGIKEQIRENNAAAKEMDIGVKKIQDKISQMEAHIRGHEREVAHYVHVFYYGEEKS